MEQKKLSELLHLQKTMVSDRTPFCPGDHEIAAHLDGNQEGSDAEKIERHLVNCEYCLARATVLARLHEDEHDVRIPDAVMASAIKFGHQPGRGRIRYASAWAAAAVVIISLFVIIGRDQGLVQDAGVYSPSVDPLGEDVRQLRNIKQSNPGPTVLQPVEGADIRSSQLTIRWTSVPGSLYYDIRLVSEEGFMIWQDRVEGTRSDLPDHVELISGNQYFVRVDAYLAEAKSISSPHVKFTIKGDN